MAGPKDWRAWGVVVLLFAGAARPGDLPAVLSAAQQAIDNEQYSEAIAALEQALPGANGNERLLRLLRTAYRAEIPQLLEAGDRTLAQRYIDRLRILGNDSTPTAVPNSRPPSAAGATDNVKVIMPDRDQARGDSNASAWQPARRPSAVADDQRPAPAESRIDRTINPSARVISAHAIHPPAAPTSSKSAAPASNSKTLEQANLTVKQADALFVAQRYREAAELYNSAHKSAPDAIDLAHDRWIYSRLAQAVDEINAPPTSSQQWSALQKELLAVVEAVPDNSFAQSLLQLADRRIGPSVYAKANETAIVRASEPDRPEPKEANLLGGLAARIGLAAKNSSMRSAWRRFRSGTGQVLETSNFRIHASDDQLAGQIADIAESTRLELYKTWYGALPDSTWNPKCDIYVHDSADQYARITHQGPASPGHSQTGIDRGRVTSRRVDLRRDGRDLVNAILPHEITHVVLADRFTSRPMPRWADEGMAVLTEPIEKKQAHLRSLGDFLKRGSVFSARQLMTMDDYPDGSQWPMFYAESVSLVEFLVGRATPDKFIDFMDGAQKRGYEYELKRVYNISGFDELDRAWSSVRTSQVAAAVSSTASR